MESKNISCLYAAYICSQIVGLFAIILSVYWIFIYNEGLGFSGTALFNWHPLLLSIAMMFLLGNGIMTFRIWRRDHAKKNLKFVHFGLNASALVFTLLGIAAVIAFKRGTRKLMFFSLHGFVGFFGLAVYLLQAVVSIVTFFTNRFSSESKTTFIPFHIFLGHLIFISGLLSIISGFNEEALFYLTLNYTTVGTWASIVANFIGVLCAVYGILVVFVTSHQPFKRPLLPEESSLLASRDSVSSETGNATTSEDGA